MRFSGARETFFGSRTAFTFRSMSPEKRVHEAAGMLVRIPPEQRRSDAVLDPDFLPGYDPPIGGPPTGPRRPARSPASGTGPEAARPSASANADGG